MRTLLALAGLAFASLAFSADVPKVIFDSDMSVGFDDVGAMAVLHALADAGECEILGTLVCTREAPASGMVEMINDYYGRGDLPIGAPRTLGPGRGTEPDGMKHDICRIYEELVAEAPNLRYPTSDKAPDANEVYRRLLAAAPDGSVTILSVGFTTNLRRLLETKADAISPLAGPALVAKKVKAWYAMACRYPTGWEYNAGRDAASSKIVFAEWPTPVYFLDFCYGEKVKCGTVVAKRKDAVNPVRDVFKRALKVLYKDLDHGHCAWDEVTVLAAVRGWQKYFGVERGTFAIIDEKGSTAWTPSAMGSHYVLTEKTPCPEVARIIDELMARPPKAKASKQQSKIK